ncbi:sigma-70 family RNA polymerase sigma factor [Aeromicrobium phragmitis]|nr:sigma-70 family RNA polymerase sigma factor [Aeromicrobium phragmitis]
MGNTARSADDDEIVDHMPLVGHVVREMMSRVPAHVSRDDLTAAGLAALVQAARSFDDSLGVPFAKYAVRRIRGAVIDELRAVDWASRSVRRRAREVERTRAELAGALGRVPAHAEIATAMGVPVDEVLANDQDVARAEIIALSSPAGSVIADLLPAHGPTPEQMVEHREQLDYLVHAIAELPERLRRVVEGYFLQELPMAELAAELGVTESRISQIRAEALTLIRAAMQRALAAEAADAAKAAAAPGRAARRVEAYVSAVMNRRDAAASALGSPATA